MTFSAKTPQWVCEHEKIARDKLVEEMIKVHENFTVGDGFFIHQPRCTPFRSFLGGLVCSDCCGEGCLKNKCPFKKNDQTLSDPTDNKFYLQNDDDATAETLWESSVYRHGF